MDTRNSADLSAVLGFDPDVILGGVPDAITIQDPAGDLVYANPAAAELLGFDSPRELMAVPLEDVVHRFEFRDAFGEAVSLEQLPGRRALRGEEPGELLLRVRDTRGGEELWRSTTAFPIPGSQGEVAFAVNIFRDVTEQKRAELRLRAQFEVSRVLAEASSLPEAGPAIMRAVSRSLDWDVGILWRADETAGLLRFVESWQDPGVRAGHFLEVSRAFEFRPGIGLPGRVWQSCRPAWIRDVQTDPNFPRAPAAAEDGLHGAFGFPIVRGGEVVGIMEFFSTEVREPDQDILDMTAAVGAQVGQLIGRQQAEEDRAFLVRVGDVINRSLDYERTLGELAAQAIPRLADVCLVYVQDDDGSIRRVAVRQTRAIRRRLARRLRERFPMNPDAPEGVPKVLRTGRSELRTEADAALMSADVVDPEAQARFLEPLGIRSWMCVPLTARGRTFGAISFVSAESGRRFGRADLALAEEVAARAAVAVDNARLYRRAERANERLAYLAEVSRSLSSSLNYRRTLGKMARLTVPRLADWCAVDIVDEDGAIELVAVAHSDPSKVRLARRLRRRYPPDPDGPGGVAHVLRTGRSELYSQIAPEILEATARDEEHLSLLRELRLGSVMIVPLAARGRVLGAMTLVSAESGRTFGRQDLRLAEEVAGRAAVAVDNARLYEERATVARTLQQSLLPPDLPELPGVELAASYRPAAAGDDIGGDFYDVFQTAEDEWTLVIGDVCGKGVTAAALTGLARHTIRATAMRGLGPADVLATLNEVIRRDRSDAGFCTAVVGTLKVRRGSGNLTLVCGGHPPPFVLRAGGGLDRAGAPGTLVGVLPSMDTPPRSVTLKPGDALVLYTDGVTDQRADGKLFGEERLARVIQRCVSLDAESMVQRIERAVEAFTTEPPRDDMALLAVRLLPA
ncbi:MAG: SpoIIE family protein phosphatase [Actinomycetota bacterium]